MARKSETVEMYGYKFNIVKFDVLTASAVLANLISVYGPIFGSIIGGFLSDAAFNKTEDTDRETSANDGFMYHDRWDKLERITPPLLKATKDILLVKDGDVNVTVELNGKKRPMDDEVIDEVFEDNPLGIYKLMAEVVRFNFGSFFMEELGLGKDADFSKVKAALKKKMKF